MKKIDKNNEIMKKVLPNLRIRDIIITMLFKQCICRAYRIGLSDSYNFDHQSYNNSNKSCKGCNKAVKLKREIR